MCKNITTPNCSRRELWLSYLTGEAWRQEQPQEKILHLISYTDVNGHKQSFRFLEEVKLNCTSLGTRFDIRLTDMESWEHQYHRDQYRVCQKILQRWEENGSEQYEVTWGGLLTALEDAQLSDIAGQLENALHSHYNTTLPRA